jgi:GAF domain-containing protein
MRGTEAAIVLEAGTDSRFTRGRWLLVEPKKSVLCAPVSVEGRYLGLIELADPEDGAEFTEDDRNGLTYVANAFARFLAGRGVVLSDDGTIDEALAL